VVKLLNLHDQWSDTELVNTVAERQRVSDMLRNDPDLLDMLGLS
jgi:hypothetical protein